MVTLNTGVIGKKCMIYSNCGIVTDPLIGNYIYIYIHCVWNPWSPIHDGGMTINHIYIYTLFFVRGIYEPVKIHLLISIYIYNGLYYQVYQGLLLLTMEININQPLKWDWDRGVLRGLCAWINYNDLTSRPQWNDGECRG